MFFDELLQFLQFNLGQAYVSADEGGWSSRFELNGVVP